MNESPASPFQRPSNDTDANEPGVISTPAESPAASDDDGTGFESTDLDAIATEFDQIEAALPQLDDGSYFSGVDAHTAE